MDKRHTEQRNVRPSRARASRKEGRPASSARPNAGDAAKTISVAVIADNRLVRETFAQKLGELPDLRVVLAAPTVDSALLSHAHPEVVLLDAGMRDESSLRLAVSVKKEFPASKVIVMDRLPVHEGIAEFVNAGVAGFILKDATFEDFVGTIRTVAKGACVLPPQMIGTLFSQIAGE